MAKGLEYATDLQLIILIAQLNSLNGFNSNEGDIKTKRVSKLSEEPLAFLNESNTSIF